MVTGPIKGFWRDDDGATAIEYGLIMAFVAVAAIVGFTTAGEALQSFFAGTSTKVLESAPVVESPPS